jgi:predicted GIY-YIG superfamily endonuclease
MIYLLHFKSPFKHARHYLGFTESPTGLDARLAKHASGSGAKLMRAVSQAGIDFDLARVWPDGDRTMERQLKNRNNTPTLCPICNPNAHKRASGKE